MRTRVMLVEDDPRMRQALTLALVDEDCSVVEADSGETALRLAVEERIDVVLLDLMLPGIDGLAVCRQLRARGSMPIIIVTARSASGDVIAGLESGADDYVTKPFVAGEVVARVRALLRRTHIRPDRADSGTLRVADLELRPMEGRVIRDGEDVHLTRTEFKLLVELVSAAGRVVTREQLLERVWGYGYFADTRLLDVHIRRLRQKIEPAPDQPRRIVTVRGVGYRVET